MTQATWKLIGDILIYLNACACLAFVVMYATLAPWYRTETGRNIMSVMGVLAASLCYFGWAVSRGGIPNGFYPVRATLFAAMLLVIGRRVALFVKNQLFVRRAADKKGKADHEMEDTR